MAKYRKKPVEIEAIQYTGNNIAEINEFVGIELQKKPIPSDLRGIEYKLLIPTLEGDMEASPWDFIIKGINGEFYPCKPDIFEKTYDEV